MLVTGVLESVVTLAVFVATEELSVVVAAAVGVTIKIVARSTVCVLGSALALPTHML